MNLGSLTHLQKMQSKAVSYCIGGVISKAAFAMTIEFMELQTSQEALDPIPKFVVPSLPFIGVSLLSNKEDSSACKGLRRVKILKEYVLMGSYKKAAEEEEGSDEKSSPRSEENESTDMLDSGGIDDCEKDEANGIDGSRFR